MKKHHLDLAKKTWQEHLLPGDIAIDATCGNGHDTLVLSQILLPHPESLIFAFDIQEKAIANSKKNILSRLEEPQTRRVQFHHKSHEAIGEILYPKAPRLIVFNLGYLPGGDKSITTQTSSTLKSVSKCLNLLALDGALSIMCYPGHEEGAREEKALADFFSSLSPLQWQIIHTRYLNRPKSPSHIWALSIR